MLINCKPYYLLHEFHLIAFTNSELILLIVDKNHSILSHYSVVMNIGISMAWNASFGEYLYNYKETNKNVTRCNSQQRVFRSYFTSI